MEKLLFVDTNIWLDFYRARNETGLTLLDHVESVSDKLIVTFQLEAEFKRNRQAAILEGMKGLKAPDKVPQPGIFSDAKSSALLAKNIREAGQRVKGLQARLEKVLADPAKNDPVYKACQRMFHKIDDLVLTREDTVRHVIRRKAYRRFLHGCSPRKPNDTSLGDALNWEWMVYCAKQRSAELVIVSRDTDYGFSFDKKVYINDELKQEFAERVSKKRKILLYNRLSDALKHFDVPVTQVEVEEEDKLVSARTPKEFQDAAAPNVTGRYGLLAALERLIPDKVVRFDVSGE